MSWIQLNTELNYTTHKTLKSKNNVDTINLRNIHHSTFTREAESRLYATENYAIVGLDYGLSPTHNGLLINGYRRTIFNEICKDFYSRK